MHTDNLFGDLVYQNLLKNLFLGYGPDTSNFIEDGQNSHRFNSYRYYEIYPKSPPQLFIELLLETGIIGTSLFIIFILFLNYRIFHRSNFIEKKIFNFFLMVIFGGIISKLFLLASLVAS